MSLFVVLEVACISSSKGFSGRPRAVVYFERARQSARQEKSGPRILGESWSPSESID